MRTNDATPPQRAAKRKQAHPKKQKNNEEPHIREIRYLQQTTELLIRKAPFYRLIREILERYARDIGDGSSYRVQSLALQALQEATEFYLVQLLEDAYRCTLHRDRVTLAPKDIRLARMLRGANDPGQLQ